MTAPDPKLLSAWKHVLTLSKVKSGEAVTLLVSSNTNAQNYAAASLAASELGATVTTVTLPQTNGELSLSRDKTAYVGVTALKDNKAALAALKTATSSLISCCCCSRPSKPRYSKVGHECC